MKLNKNKLRRTLALTASVAIMGTSIPFNVSAESALPNPANVVGVTRNASQEEWQNGDFVIEGTTVKGFSDKGKEKVKTNKNLVIPEGVTLVDNSAFKNNQLTSVIIPDSVTKIERDSFACNKLTSITIPNSVTTIGGGAFNRNQLTSVTIPDSVTSIGSHAFSFNQLTSVTIPNSVTSIGDCAFYNNQLTSVTIPNSVDIILAYTFSSNQLKSVTIPDSVEAIEFYAFQNNQLTSVTIPDSVKAIRDYAFYNNQLTSITIPDSVTTIGDYAFENNQLTELTLGNSVTTIGLGAFSQNQLTSVTIPNSVTSIGKNSFSNNQLTSVTTPNSVNAIGVNAFAFQSILFYPKQNPFKLKDIGISLKNRRENINDISPYVESYNELNKEKEKLSFPRDIKETTLETKMVSDYQYSVNIKIYNPGKYVTDMGTIAPVPTINKDDIEKEIVSWGKTYDLTNNIKNLPEGAVVSDITNPAIDTKKPGEYIGKAKVIFKGGSSRVVDIPVKVEKSMADTFAPEITEEEVIKGNKIDLIDNITNLPEGATVKDITNPKVDTNELGDIIAKAEITFSDGSTKVIDIPVKVVLVVETITPIPTVDKENILPEIVPWGKAVDLTDNIKNLPEGAIVKDITDPAIDTKKSGEYTGKVEVEFKDGSKRKVEIPVTVNKSESENFTPEILEEEVIRGNPIDLTDNIKNLPEGAVVVVKTLVDTSVTGDKNGVLTVKFSDGSTKDVNIPVKVLPLDSIVDNKDTNNDNNHSSDILGGNFNAKSDGVIPEYKTKSDENGQESKHKTLDKLLNGPSELGRRKDIKTNGYTIKYIFKIGEKSYKTISGDNVNSYNMDVAPYTKNDRAMLPIRYVAEAIGAGVQWDNSTRTAYFEKDGLVAKIQIDGNKIVMSNGKVYEMDTKPDSINDRILVSVTNVSKVFNLTNGNTKDGINQNIEWDNDNGLVTIVK